MSAAEVFHPSEFIVDEMEARGWTLHDLASRMPGDYEINVVALKFYFAAPNIAPDMILGEESAAGLAAAFGTSAEYWLNHDRMWRDHLAARARPARTEGR